MTDHPRLTDEDRERIKNLPKGAKWGIADSEVGKIAGNMPGGIGHTKGTAKPNQKGNQS